jgi:hypothetical protein
LKPWTFEAMGLEHHRRETIEAVGASFMRSEHGQFMHVQKAVLRRDCNGSVAGGEFSRPRPASSTMFWREKPRI